MPVPAYHLITSCQAHNKLRVRGIPNVLDVHVCPPGTAFLTGNQIAAMGAEQAAREAFRCMDYRNLCSGHCVLELALLKYRAFEMSDGEAHMAIMSSKPYAKPFPTMYRSISWDPKHPSRFASGV